MLLTISTTHSTPSSPATDLGYLLHKNPANYQRFELPFGKADVFYPEASEEKCTATLMLEVDPVELTRPKEGRRPGSWLQDYVNDRPYTASSYMSVAIASVFGNALRGQSKERPELAHTPIPLKAEVQVVPSRAGGDLIANLFEPLGYEVELEGHTLDEQFPDWGESQYFTVKLSQTVRLKDLLSHLYVLLPVLDNEKHYFVGKDEVEKLLRHSEGWLGKHPKQELISKRYLKYRQVLVDQASGRLAEPKEEEVGPEEVEPEEVGPEEVGPEEVEPEETLADSLLDRTSPASPAGESETESVSIQTPGQTPGHSPAQSSEEGLEKPMRLGDQRTAAVLKALREIAPESVLDLGCGEGKLLAELAAEPTFKKIAGVEVSQERLARARRRLKLGQRSKRGNGTDRGESSQAGLEARVELIHGSLTYRDRRLSGYAAAVAMEVIEHIEPDRLGTFEQVVFGEAKPRAVLITTPNVEYNQLFVGMEPGTLRHRDHRFEWTRKEFEEWAERAAQKHDYNVRFQGIGTEDETHGQPTQMGIFTQRESI